MGWSTPRTWVAGEKPSAATFNTHIRDQFNAIGDPWASFTPTLAGWTLGNGTLTGRYAQAGKMTWVRVELIVGSSTTIAGTLLIDLPSSAPNLSPAVAVTGAPLGTGWAYDDSAAAHRYLFTVRGGVANRVHARTEAGSSVAPTVPHTWAAGDRMILNMSYESA